MCDTDSPGGLRFWPATCMQSTRAWTGRPAITSLQPKPCPSSGKILGSQFAVLPWVGYRNIKVLDPNTGESKWKKRRVGVLGPKSRMTKHQAHDSLDLTIAQKTAGTTQPRAEKSIATLGWFTRNRYFALREGSIWKKKQPALASRPSRQSGDTFKRCATWRSSAT